MPIVYGMNHQSAPLPVREKAAFPVDGLAASLSRLAAAAGIEEALILSTCNRTEIIVELREEGSDPAALATFLAAERPVTGEELERHCYLYAGRDAVRHVFRTAASLDSMVLGEAQILGQVKEAYALAGRAGTIGPVLDALLRRAFTVAKRVRSETGIARHPVSVASAAVGLARDIFGDLRERAVMIVGAGKMARLAAQHLVGDGVGSVRVANRSWQQADDLARGLGGRAVPFERLFEEMDDADIVITSTSSPQPIIRREHAQRLARARRGRPLFFVDIALPRDVERAVNEVENVYLYDLDDLNAVLRSTRDTRRGESAVAETMVEEETEAFLAWMITRQAAPAIIELRRHLHELALQEVVRFRSRMGDLTPAQEEAVRGMAAALVNKLLHAPTLALKRLASDDGAARRLLRDVFGLEGTGDAAGSKERPAGSRSAAADGQRPVKRA